jgi:Neprosin
MSWPCLTMTRIRGTVTVPMIAFVALLSCATPQSANASLRPSTVTVDGQPYRCADRTPAQAAPVPRPPQSFGDLAAPMTPRHAICPVGQVPAPLPIVAPPPVPPPSDGAVRMAGHVAGSRAHGGRFVAPEGPIEQDGADYFYGVQGREVEESELVTALEGHTTNQWDYVSPSEPGAHSIAQLWALDELPDGNYSDVEFGWINSSYFGSSEPALFVYHFDNSEATCYNGCGFVQTSNNLGYVAGYPISGAASLFTLGPTHNYQIYEEGTSGKWYVAIDGEVVGYYPASAWTQMDPTLLTVEEAGGEVASETTNSTPQATMGDGDAASSEESADWAGIRDLSQGSARWVSFSTFTESTPAYSVGTGGGFVEGGPPGSNFRYGGPGWCNGQNPGYCVPPLATIEESTRQTKTEATLAGTVNPNGLDTHYYFQYGTSPSLGSEAPAQPGDDAGSGMGSEYEEVDITGLSPATTYYYRIVAESAAGASDSTDQSFTTLPNAPTVTNEQESSVTQTSTTLNSTSNPNNAPLSGPSTLNSAISVKEYKASKEAHSLKIAVGGVRVKRYGLTLELTTTQVATLEVSGVGLKTTRVTLGAGTHRLEVLFTRLGRTERAHRRKVTMRLSLAVGAEVASKTILVKL